MNRVEMELARVLHERAQEIESVPAYRFEPAARRLRMRSRRTIDRRRTLVALASATAVTAAAVTLAAGAWLGRGDRKHVPPPAACTSTSEVAGAVRADALPVGDSVLSGTADGSALIAVERRGVATAVDVVDGAGRTSRLWTAAARERMRAVANPSGSLSGDGAVFVLVPVGASDDGQVVVVDRATRHAARLVSDPGFGVSANPRLAPILVGSAVTVLETSRSDSRAQRLALYWADTALLTPDGSTATSAVTTLLPVGGNVVAVRTWPDGSVTADFDQPGYRPSTLDSAVRHGFGFTSDGTTMRWLSASGDRYRSWRWAPGDPSPVSRMLVARARPVSTAGQYALAPHELIDSLTGRAHPLPAGLAVVRVDGAVATVDQRSAGFQARIPVAVLRTC